MKVLTVAEVAREIGKSESWLRKADSSRRIPRAKRDANGWRYYTPDEVEKIRRIAWPEELG